MATKSKQADRQRQAAAPTRRKWHWMAMLVLAIVLLAAGAFEHFLRPALHPSANGNIDQPVGEAFLKRLHQISEETQARTAPLPGNPLQALSGAPALDSQRPGVLYVGGDFCPYCAAVRWPLALALLRFGDLEGMRYMRSSHTDVYADTVTFSFYGSHFKSSVLDFQGIEVRDREGKRLEPLTGFAKQIFERFNSPPYTNSPGAIPFLYLNGRYALYGAPLSPQLLADHDWNQVLDALEKQPQGKLAEAIVGATNLLSAAFCELTGGKPEDTCKAPGVAAARKGVPPAPPGG